MQRAEVVHGGWLKYQIGVFWQDALRVTDNMLRHGTAGQIWRLAEALLPGKKSDVANL